MYNGKQEKLINKVKHFLKKINARRYLHHFGPKTYELWQHVFALFVKANCKFSYRQTSYFLRSLSFKVASKSTLQRYSAKLNASFWQRMFKLTIQKSTEIMAIDGTGLEKSRASEHYIKRINSDRKSGRAFHFSILSDANNKIISLRLRKKYCGDPKDVKYLYKNALVKPKIILMDKGYDAEWIHKLFRQDGIETIIPARKNAKRGFYRLLMKGSLSKQLYNKRNMVESTFHSFKQKFGSSVSSKLITSARSEVYCKAILHNIFLKIMKDLGHTRLQVICRIILDRR